MKESWGEGDPYEYFMGRWSRLLADRFVRWIGSPEGLRWLDVGCGSGALGAAVISRCGPAGITAVDQSEGFVKTARDRLGPLAECKVGNALSLPLNDSAVDITVSGLMLNFIPVPERALDEMKRVTKVGGTVAAYIWDYAGKMEFLRHFWDAVVDLQPEAENLRESRRFANSNGDFLRCQFACAGFAGIETQPIDITMRFTDFDDYWLPFLGGQGPAPTYVQTLIGPDQANLREALKDRLVTEPNGSINLEARAWAVRGTR